MTRLLPAFAVLIAIPAMAHDRMGNANWIRDGHFMSPIDGSHCCGPADCVMVPSEYVKEASGGYLVKGELQYPGGISYVNEWVPPKEIQQSRDGNHWRCKKGDGSRRCYFAPPGAV